MSTRNKIIFLAVLITVAVATSLFVSPNKEFSGYDGQAFETKTNEEGDVTVKVTPLALASGASEWKFEVILDTHTVELSEDLVSLAKVFYGDDTVRALRWEGDSPGGHHRSGFLIFPAPESMPESITITIENVGGVTSRTFTWNLSVNK